MKDFENGGSLGRLEDHLDEALDIAIRPRGITRWSLLNVHKSGQ
jgi:hypothetical protein